MPLLILLASYVISMTGLLLIDGVDNEGKPYQMRIFDAFYFISYTASTIGFGETPYAFTYPQRLWVSFSIYLTVFAWFYSIGTLVSLLQNKMLIAEISKNRFRRQVRKLDSKFVIILGYNLVTKDMIEKLILANIRPVVIDNNQERINEVEFGNFKVQVPSLVGDFREPKVLEDAGIKLLNCYAILSPIKNDALNLHVSIVSKLLNPNIVVAARSSSIQNQNELVDVGVEIIENPFEMIAADIRKRLTSPYLLAIQNWTYGKELEISKHTMPHKRYIVCGYGRMGDALYNTLLSENIEVVFIEIDVLKKESIDQEKHKHIIFENADSRHVLMDAGIMESDCIIVATENDTINLSILITARKLNPNIFTMVRENNISEVSIFKAAKIDTIYTLEQMIIDKTIIAVAKPLKYAFVKQLKKQNDDFSKDIYLKINEEVSSEPILQELTINSQEAYALNIKLENGEDIEFQTLSTSLHDNTLANHILPLFLVRDKKEYLLPEPSMTLRQNDCILFACDKVGREDLLTIAENISELEYVLVR